MSGAGDTATGRGNQQSLESIQPPESPAFEGNKTNLIVNYLPPTLSDEAFVNLFSAIGPITNHKVVRDPSTGGCLGYGFVEYGSEVDAKIAILKLNGLKLLNKTLKVAYARPKSAKTKNCTLYITALPPFTTNESLKEMFSPYGTVINSKVLLNMSTKLCNGAGFVLFALTDECEAAVRALHGTKPQGSMNAISVKYAHSNVTKKNQMNQGGPMGFMPGNNQSFAGPMRGGRNQMGRMNPTARPEPGIMCDPTLAQRTPLGVVIYIRGFSLDADDEELYSLFSPFGTVRKVSVMRDAEGTSRGYGFVTMADDQEAVRAVLKLNRSKYKERVIDVRFKEAKGPGMQGDSPMMNQNNMMNPNMMMGQNNMMMGQNSMMNPNMMGQNSMMNPNMMGQNSMMNPNMMGQNMNPNMMGQNNMMMGQNAMMNQNMMNQNMMDDNMGGNQSNMGMMGNQGGAMMGNQGGMIGNQGGMMGNQGGMMGGQQQEMGMGQSSRQSMDNFNPDDASLPPPVSRGGMGMRRKPFVDPAAYNYEHEYY